MREKGYLPTEVVEATASSEFLDGLDAREDRLVIVHHQSQSLDALLGKALDLLCSAGSSKDPQTSRVEYNGQSMPYTAWRAARDEDRLSFVCGGHSEVL
jgi:fructose-specific component phosphotransferase system IIB-like protein